LRQRKNRQEAEEQARLLKEQQEAEEREKEEAEKPGGSDRTNGAGMT